MDPNCEMFFNNGRGLNANDENQGKTNKQKKNQKFYRCKIAKFY